MDSQRAIVGCEDAKALIFDMHSGKMIRSLPPNPGPVTALYVFDCDDFLVTAGKNIQCTFENVLENTKEFHLII